MNSKITNAIPSVNYHLWRPCNANCSFCFATFEDSRSYLPKGHLSKDDSIKIIDEIVAAGFKKITFAGGEPTLCNWLPDLIERAKLGGLTTMIVTNGFMLTPNYLKKLQGVLDWITLSVDSVNYETNRTIGRYTRKLIPDEKYYKFLVNSIKSHGFNLKINTVVSKFNYLENLHEFIGYSSPSRWKVLQSLVINEQNSANKEEFVITDNYFNEFMERHLFLANRSINIVPENNDAMLGSYVMIDPSGRFYDNSGRKYLYSSPILKVGIKEAYSQVTVDYKKYIQRNGLYNWGNAHATRDQDDNESSSVLLHTIKELDIINY